ncbi:PREDICTED: uncharacterized protein LOC108972419 [Bactrocera latifrons]|uniref:uncharacterized protein LOC108972419 n=1 Tax=Bactrocera latifrons TaxID=174628 RepID=UPI0008DCD966|nr:PREDICTED: uncharacterized protein LOC108972419 [Bactrocera latifrons]
MSPQEGLFSLFNHINKMWPKYVYLIVEAFIVTSLFRRSHAQSVSCDNAVQAPLISARSSLPIFQIANPRDTDAIKALITDLLAELAFDDKERQNPESESRCPLMDIDREGIEGLIQILLEELKDNLGINENISNIFVETSQANLNARRMRAYMDR